MRGAMWSPKVTYSTRCIAGFGLVATKPLTKGEVLFVAPRSACLVSRRDRGDTQRRAATKLIKEARKKSRSRWRPFLRTLKPAPCPWTWNAKDRSLLQGTELEAVVQLKVARLDAERRLVEEELSEKVSRRTYAQACAIVASHANPWFGRSLTPFNCTLNYAKEDHITFEEDEDMVIGRARFDTHAGELFQTYAWAHTDLIYRYGFVPESDELLPEDVVSIAINDVMTACDCGDSPVARLLLLANACDEAPYDGLGDILTCEIGVGGEGLGRLVACCFALNANHIALIPKLKRSPCSGDADSDAWAACLAAAMVDGGVHDEMKPIALEYGGDDRDPWPRLLEKCRELDGTCFDDAVDIARICLENRRNAVSDTPLRDVLALQEGEDEVVVQIPPPAPPGSPQYLARRLKSVERRLLDGALAVLARRGAAEVLP